MGPKFWKQSHGIWRYSKASPIIIGIMSKPSDTVWIESDSVTRDYKIPNPTTCFHTLQSCPLFKFIYIYICTLLRLVVLYNLVEDPSVFPSLNNLWHGAFQYSFFLIANIGSFLPRLNRHLDGLYDTGYTERNKLGRTAIILQSP